MVLYEELEHLKRELGIIEKVYCSSDEEEKFKDLENTNSPLPEDIEVDELSHSHFRYVKSNMSKEEILELILYRQTKYLATIKNCLIFFVILNVVFLVLSFIIR